MKNIYCIRHGLAYHNVKALEMGSQAYVLDECFDAPLVDKGLQQAKDLGEQWEALSLIQKVFVSPLTRTLETCQEIFKMHPDVKIIALDVIKEFPQGLQICNKRRDKKDLQEKFSRIDFSQLESESDQIWRKERMEHIEELRERIQDFKKFLKGLEETDVAVVSHSAFLNETLYGRIGDEANQLKHCHPYPLDLN
ncbi:MAG: histidine phosphatase family protein [SAR324 cluster bacterium]|jgi:broad specificity phosphatase PhoE|nr:histidine phosphatase family protein [SAR324 cluster bacterium]MEE1577288.1 histidine phosphatase family protein [Deltaproteobacteria bacterium]MDP6245605.1 histidine phosphatase family protein [SAR324 cluster bacterium]MDP6465841.1 histidine phosphatase family protein [SAR324 cluster bacterium]MDP6638304.1 histidine phosphatase family protein [SAR324 cluster bacterium]|tara:strand:- start:266 stop:850 length:585 start_codon:yes stop_codon:yes gene_type:complete